MSEPQLPPSSRTPLPGAAAAMPSSPFAYLAGLVPGILLTAAIAGAALALRQLPGIGMFSPMILAILIGILIRNALGTPAIAKPGIVFSMRRILRAAIILLGFQLTIGQIVAVGADGLAVIVVTLIATFVFTVQAGRLFGVSPELAKLIAAGTSICGASAVIATNTVVRASDEDAAYAVACVTIFGTIAMFLYPLLPALLNLDAQSYGLWAGASIHEIAQVVAAAFQGGQAAGEFGTIAKLARVIMLAPLVIALGVIAARRAAADGESAGTASVPLPWFVLGFIALVGLNSVVSVPDETRAMIGVATAFMLAMALAAMGLEIDLRKLRSTGLRPMLLGAAAFAFIACFSLALIKLIG